MREFRYPLLAAVALTVACAGAGTTTSASPRSSQYLIGTAEIQTQHFSNAYDLVNALRPSWLQSRAASFGTGNASVGVMVYLDENRLGGPEYLKQISLGALESLKYMSATEATTRYGTNHAGGAIIVTSKRP